MKGAKKGFAAVKVAKKAAAASGRRNVPSLYIREDEPPVPVAFNGDNDEPLVVDTHTIKYNDAKGKPRYEEAYCSMEETGECEGCDRNAAGDKRVGPRTKKAALSVVDLRWHGRVEGKEFNGEKQFYLNALPSDAVDPFEPAPKKYKDDRGTVYTDIVRTDRSLLLLLAMGRADSLGAEEQAANRKCKGCGKGKLSIDGYKVGKGKIVPELEDDQEGVPQYSCNKCDDPEPFSIFGVNNPTIITRSGSGKSTTYSFKLDMMQDLEEMGWAKELEKLDLEAATAPTNASRYEKLLGGGKAQKAEKEVEDDDDETPKDDDDDDSLYNKTEKKSEKKPKKKLLKKK